MINLIAFEILLTYVAVSFVVRTAFKIRAFLTTRRSLKSEATQHGRKDRS